MDDCGTDRAGGDEMSREERVRRMYSEIRYPGLNPEHNARYVRHRRFVYGCLGLDVDRFFHGKTVLDAGCGTGEETLFLASLGAERVIGIDTSRGSLELAREGAERLGLSNVEFREGSVLDTRLFADGFFDYVSSLGCIHHTPDMAAAFANLARMVRPSGHLCTFIYNSWGHFLYNLECDWLDRAAGDIIEARMALARRYLDWRRRKVFAREGIPASYSGRLYDKYGVLYRESISLGRLLAWYRDAGFTHTGSFPMYVRDMVDAMVARDGGLANTSGVRGMAARALSRVLPRRGSGRRRVPGR